MSRRATAAKVELEPIETFDVYTESFAGLPFADREHFDVLLATVGLELASYKTRDAFWLDCSPHWLWVRARRGING